MHPHLTPVQRLGRLWCGCRRDGSLEDTGNLPDLDVVASETVEDLQAALEQFAEIAEDLAA